MTNKKKVIETFEIEEGVELGGLRIDNELVNKLQATYKALKRGGAPFFVPVAAAKPSTVNNVLRVYLSALNKGKKPAEHQAITIRTIKNSDKQVIGVRVFRIA